MPILKRKTKPKKTAAPKKVVKSVATRRTASKTALPENTWKKAQTAEGWRRERLLEM